MIRIVQGTYTTHNLPKGSGEVRLVCGDKTIRFPSCEPPKKPIGSMCYYCNSESGCFVEFDYECSERFTGCGKLVYTLDGKDHEEPVVFIPDPRRN